MSPGRALSVLVLALGLAKAGGQEPLLFPYGTTWKFNDSGADLGTNWQAADYDDSAWPTGMAPFGWPPEELFPAGVPPLMTFLNLGNSTNSTRTFYFRKAFVFSGGSENVILVASNIIDDGAVLYLNGTEVARIAMPAGTISNQTLATRSMDVSSTGVEVIAIGDHVAAGTNFLAVEVHQSSSLNFDAVFAMALAFKSGAPPEIATQPQDLVIECAGRPANFSVAATGSDLRYQWFSNNVALTRETNASLSFPFANTNMHNAQFSVVVSNVLGVVHSRNALATVCPDTCGPRVLLALSQDFAARSNEVQVTFDEGLRPTLGFASNFTVVDLATNDVIAVTSASGTNPVRLLLGSNLSRDKSYTLSISSVSDTRSNNIAPGTRIGISFLVTNRLFDMSQGWTFRDSLPGCPPVSRDWNSVSFAEDSTWGGPEPGLLWSFNSTGGYQPCSGSFPTFSEVSTGCRSLYVRTWFQLPVNAPTAGLLRFWHFITDGAVFYVNGVEVGRTNMPGGLIAQDTAALSEAAPSCKETLVRVTNLVHGLNLIAVETHQAISALNDILFGTEAVLSWYITPPLAPPSNSPRLTVSRTGSTLTLSWSNDVGGFLLERAGELFGPWREAQPLMTNPWSTSTSGQQFFYRLRWESR